LIQKGKQNMITKKSNSGSIDNIESDVKRTGQKVAFNPLMEPMARLGYGVRGLIYIILGVLATLLAFGKSGGAADQQGAIEAIGIQPAGMFMLWIVLIGLISYSFWGLVRALFDPLHKGHDKKGLLTRAGFLLSGIGYAYLAYTTYRFIVHGGGNTQTQQQSFASIMTTTWGPWVIFIIGLIVIAIGLYQMYQGFNSSFDKQFKTYVMTTEEIKLTTQLGRFGTAARGLVFALVGGLMVLGASQSNSSQPQGIDAALTSLLRLPYGVWVLGLVALGLIAFGIYSMLCAFWFRLRKS